MGVKLGHSRKGKSTYWGSWGDYMEVRGSKWRETGEDCVLRSIITCTLRQILLEWSNQGEWDWRDIYHAGETWEMHTIFWLEKLKRRDHSKDVDIGDIVLEWILGK